MAICFFRRVRRRNFTANTASIFGQHGSRKVKRMSDFSLNKYKELCNIVIENGYVILTFNDYIIKEPHSNFVILRHDVDSKPKRALRMARLEHKLDIGASYYFRHKPSVFDPNILKEIHELGHEIGYHYEVLSKCKGNYKKSIKLFEKELCDFRKICEITTICMHGSPLSRYDNRDLWKIYDFKHSGILGETYLSAGKDLEYFSDTGCSWNPRYKLRDVIDDNGNNIIINTTDDLSDLIKTKNSKKIYLLMHPENWSENLRETYYISSENKMKNLAKKFLRMTIFKYNKKIN
jgi:hypothetical protein